MPGIIKEVLTIGSKRQPHREIGENANRRGSPKGQETQRRRTFHKQSGSYNRDGMRLCVQKAADLGTSTARNVDPGHFHACTLVRVN